jgi:serine/threonine protein kinase
MRAIFLIPTKPPPTLKNPDEWSTSFNDLIAKCLVKDPEERTTAEELLKVRQNLSKAINLLFKHEFIVNSSGPEAVREMIADAQNVAAHYLLQESVTTQLTTSKVVHSLAKPKRHVYVRFIKHSYSS